MALGQLFSQRFGYAIHALAYMAKKPMDTLTTLPELANWMRSVWPSASEAYLSNVIQRLARGGIFAATGAWLVAIPWPGHLRKSPCGT